MEKVTKKSTKKAAVAKERAEKSVNAWNKYDEATLAKVNAFCEQYKKFISENKTERECSDAIVAKAVKLGYRNLTECKSLKAGDRVYYQMMGKAVALFVIGEKPLAEGMNILGAHIDSPRLDVKQNPLYEKDGFALLDTHYYGGIKKYQWVTIPLSIHGVVVKKDGTKVSIAIGEKDDDPVFGISDLLIHLAADQLGKNAAKVVEGENLDVTFASQPLTGESKDAVMATALEALYKQYGIEKEDFLSAELEVVPAGKARDYGIDRSMIAGYGQDDRVCAFTSAEAIFGIRKSKHTLACLLVDKEEIGSVGATGMHSRFFENCVAEIADRLGQYSELTVRRALQNSFMLSSDVSAAYDPLYAEAFEKRNSAFMGRGIAFNKYTGSRGKYSSNDANAEYMATLRRILDDADVSYHTAELGKVDQGGGGTIAYIMANYGMNVIDSGVAVLSMHSPWEVTSKADIYESFKGYTAFLKGIQ
ncbi:MAG: aminopeptidase [Lachnospiraceae bacterium]|nr:aminopeptidase [Lachnospiraceae bacterium]